MNKSAHTKKVWKLIVRTSYVQKNILEISTKLNFSNKLFLYKIYLNKIYSFPQAVPPKKEKNLFTRQFSTNKLSIKPDSFYKPFPY